MFKLVDDGNILMGNDVSFKMVGVGSVWIRIHDGVIHTLINLKYVLKLSKNLYPLELWI